MVLDLGPHNPNDRNTGAPPSRLEKIVDMLVDAGIAGGIAGLSTGFLVDPMVAPKVAVGACIMAFLVKLKDLRSH